MIPRDIEAQQSLDLFSISHTSQPFCVNNSPVIAIPPHDGKQAFLYQSCCNDWTCPCCGQIRAKQEYGRIIEGCKLLSKDHDLYFLTVTCRGKEVSLADAENNYLLWTDKFLTAYRNRVNRAGDYWCYVGLTERQPKRQHPHTHFIMTCKPQGTYTIVDEYPQYVQDVAEIGRLYPAMRYKPASKSEFSFLDLFSLWLVVAAAKAGLGVQIRLSLVDNPEATAKYVSKYMFKQLGTEKWPRHWRRVRYSNNFPKLPEIESQSAFPLLSASDWRRVERYSGAILCDSEQTYLRALAARVYQATYRS